MRAGRLDRTIVIERFTISQNSYGEEIETWSTLATVAASVMPARGGERFTAEEIVGKGTVTFKIRWRADVAVENRIRYSNRIWDIHDVREVGRREGLEMDATARSE